MLFHITYYRTEDLAQLFYAFQEKARLLEIYIEPREYGEAIQEFFIGLICVSPEFKTFFKPRRDRYTKDRKVRHRDGFEIISERTFECEIELPYDTLVTAPLKEGVNFISQEVILSLDRLHKHQSKFGSFDTCGLIQDIRHFLLEK